MSESVTASLPSSSSFLAPCRSSAPLKLRGGTEAAGRFALISDLDDTLVGDEDSLSSFNSVWNSSCRSSGGKLVFNTGRSFKDYLALKKKWTITAPDYFIGACGTQIYSCDSDGNYHEVEQWKSTLDRDWNKTVVQQHVTNSDRLRSRYGTIKEKSESQGNPFLFSFKIPQADFTIDQLREDLKREIEAVDDHNGQKIAFTMNIASVAYHVNTTVSGLDDVPASLMAANASGCFFVDILPKSAGKGVPFSVHSGH
eukprot:763327-Hanusia_phi.AAC.8